MGVTEGFPLGWWVREQRKSLRAGGMDDHRKQLLDEAGMVWEPGEKPGRASSPCCGRTIARMGT